MAARTGGGGRKGREGGAQGSDPGTASERLPDFQTVDWEGRVLTDADVRGMAPTLILLLRGFG